MKKYYCIIFLLLFCVLIKAQTCNSNFGQSYYYGQENLLEIGDDIELSDSGLYVFCWISAENMVTTEISYDCQELWWNQIGGESSRLINNWYNNVDKCSDGGFIASGGYQYYDTTLNQWHEKKLALFRYNSNLDTLWTTTVGDGITFYIGYQAKQCADGGFVVVGVTYIDNILPKVYVARFNSDGDTLWTNHYEVTKGYNSRGTTIVETDEGNFIIGGDIYNEIDDNASNNLLLKIDPDGNYLDHEIIGNSIGFKGTAQVEKVSDGNFIYGASTGNESAESYESFYCKFDSNLDTIWTRHYHISNFYGGSFGVKENPDGSFISVGNGLSNLQLEIREGTLAKLDSQGNLLWKRHYQHSDTIFFMDRLYDVIRTPNGGYAACGTTLKVPLGQQYWVLITDSMGCVVPGCDTLVSVFELEKNKVGFEIYPNPANDIINIYFESLDPHPKGKFTLYNMQGQMVSYFLAATSGVSYILDVNNISSGIYLLEYTDDNGHRMSKKVIIE